MISPRIDNGDRIGPRGLGTKRRFRFSDPVQVPQREARVAVRRGENMTVGGKRERRDLPQMPAEGGALLTRRRIPEFDRPVGRP